MQDSLFLMERPSFFEGMARAFDLGNTMTVFNELPDGNAADRAALWADWELIANDLKIAAQKYARSVGGVQAKQSR